MLRYATLLLGSFAVGGRVCLRVYVLVLCAAHAQTHGPPQGRHADGHLALSE